MLLIYCFTFLALGILGFINSVLIFVKEKSFISLPQLTKKYSTKNTLRYQACVQVLCGISFILYGIAIVQLSINSLFIHIIFLLIAFTFSSLIGHARYL